MDNRVFVTNRIVRNHGCQTKKNDSSVIILHVDPFEIVNEIRS